MKGCCGLTAYYSVGSSDQFQGFNIPYHYPPYGCQVCKSGYLSKELQHILHGTQPGVLGNIVFIVCIDFYHHTFLGLSHGQHSSHNQTTQSPDIDSDQGNGLLASTSLATLKSIYFAGIQFHLQSVYHQLNLHLVKFSYLLI